MAADARLISGAARRFSPQRDQRRFILWQMGRLAAKIGELHLLLPKPVAKKHIPVEFLLSPFCLN